MMWIVWRAERGDYLPGWSTWVSERLWAAPPRLDRRMALTVPLAPPPQKN
jgi:hypothetical protein